jgi:hypothetical protein
MRIADEQARDARIAAGDLNEMSRASPAEAERILEARRAMNFGKATI